MSHAAAFRRWLSAVAPDRRTTAASSRRPARGRTTGRRLVLEQLEDRTVLSYVVTSLADSGTGTLREAIGLANSANSPSIIDFAVTGAINLTSSLALQSNITIQGPGAGSLTVQRATDTPFGIFSIDANQTVSISGLIIANGYANGNGGGISNHGTLTVTDCTLANDSASLGGGILNGGTLTVTDSTLANDSASDGGGIFNGGTLTVTNCTLANDSASDGGGIFNDGTLTVTDSILTNNSATNDGGGGIYIGDGTATVTDCTLANNSAAIAAGGGGGDGGGIYNFGTLTVTNCTFANDSAVDGGGNYNHGTLTVTNSTLANDSAFGGGGIYNFGTLTVTNSTLANDSSSLFGGILNDGTLTVTDSTLANDSSSDGGGIHNSSSGTATVTNSTLANDSALVGGGIFNTGTLTVTDSTLANDSASDGGGIYNFGTLTVTDSTLANDSATLSGGGIYIGGGTATLNNTIVANSPSGGDVVGVLAMSSSYNLIGIGVGMTGINNGTQGNQVGTAANPINPLLGPLQNNGGPTQTLALLPGSPAIDAGSNALAVVPATSPTTPRATTPPTPLTTDQRGVARVVNGTVDIGAFESRNFTIAITSGNGQGTTVNTSLLNPLVVTVSSPYGDPVQGGMVLFTVAASAGGAGATLTNGTTPVTYDTTAKATIDPVGQAAVAVKANTVAGSYAVTVSAVGATFPGGFSLTNMPGAAYRITPAAGASGQGTTVGYAFAAPLQVTVTDQFGNAVPGVSITYAAPTIGPSGTVVGGAVVTTDARGIAAPTFLANTVAGGPYTVTARAGGLAGSPVSFLLTNTLDVASRFVVSGFLSTTGAGIAHPFTVTALDPFGNVATDYVGLVHFTSTDPQAMLPADAVLTGGAGTFTATLKTAGTQSLNATDTQVASLAGAQTSITVNPAAASRLLVSAPSIVSAGVPFTVIVTALDPFGNVATDYVGLVHFTSTDPQAMLPADAVLTGGAGTFTATLKTAGTQSLNATDTQVASLAGAQTSITVNPAAASRLLVSAPSIVSAGVPFTVIVTALDPFGNVATGYSDLVHFTSTDPQALLPANALLTGGAGTFTATLKTAGNQVMTATDTQVASVTGTQSGITVNPAAASRLLVSAPSIVSAGVPFTVIVTALDPFGNVATGYSGTIHFSSTDPQALLPANALLTGGAGTFTATLKTAGNQVMTATDTQVASVTGTQSGITVNPAAASRLLVSAPSIVSAGVPFTVIVTALDPFGNVATGYSGTIHFSSSDKKAVLHGNVILSNGTGTFTTTFSTKGAQILTVADIASPGMTGLVTILVDAPIRPK